MRLILAVVLFFSLSYPAWAAESTGEIKPPLRLFEAPCRELGLPCPAAVAIAQVESGLHPWSLNIEGRGFKFQSREEALARAGEALALGRSFDVGLMQVNSWWLKRYGISLEAAFEPLANIYLGGWILKEEIERRKDLKAAVGAYHSPDPRRARRYADQVMAALERGPLTPPESGPKPKTQAAQAATKAPPKGLPFEASPMTLAQNKPSSMLVSTSSPSMKVSFKQQ